MENTTAVKKTKAELSQMTSAEISNHITEITQTEICKDLKYCKYLMKVYLAK